jgi:hypothetical protein
MNEDDPAGAYRRLLAKLNAVSAHEAMEQVHRRRIFTLCTSCVEVWLESPFPSS